MEGSLEGNLRETLEKLLSKLLKKKLEILLQRAREIPRTWKKLWECFQQNLLYKSKNNSSDWLKGIKVRKFPTYGLTVISWVYSLLYWYWKSSQCCEISWPSRATHKIRFLVSPHHAQNEKEPKRTATNLAKNPPVVFLKFFNFGKKCSTIFIDSIQLSMKQCL